MPQTPDGAAPLVPAAVAAAVAEQIRGIAAARFEGWSRCVMPLGATPRTQNDRDSVGSLLALRIQALLEDPLPAAAARRWFLESVAAWAPLAALFAGPASHDGTAGASGQLAAHSRLIVEREYGHVLGAARNLDGAIALLRVDLHRLQIVLDVAEDVGRTLGVHRQGEGTEWLATYKEMSLAMAEFLHRQAIGLSQVIPDSTVMRYTAQISRAQRELRPAALGRVQRGA